MEVVVLAPGCQGSDLSVGRIVAVSDQADAACIVSKLNNGVGAMHEQGVKEKAENAA